MLEIQTPMWVLRPPRIKNIAAMRFVKLKINGLWTEPYATPPFEADNVDE